MTLTHKNIADMRALMDAFLAEADATVDALEAAQAGAHGELVSVELSGDTLDVLITSPGVSPPNGTPIGDFVGRDASGNEVPFDWVTLLDDAGGRFYVSGDALLATGKLADFEDPGDLSAGVNPRPIQFYSVKVRVTAGTKGIEATFYVRPRYPYINPKGGAGQPVSKPTNMATLYSTLAVAEKKLVDLSTMQGVQKADGLSQLKPKLKQVSIVGHPRVCMRHGKAWMFREGNDVVIQGMAFRVGMPAALTEVDNIAVGESSGNWARNMHFRNCSFSSSNDELMRVNDSDSSGFAARHVRLSYCMFVEAFFGANHPKGVQHNHGPALSGRCQDVVMDHCLIGSNDYRNPEITRAICGVGVVNNVIFHWLEHENFAGCNSVGSDAGPEKAWQLTARIEGNLFYPVGRSDNAYGERKNAILVTKCDGNMTNVYVPDFYAPNSGARPNHFINPATDTFKDDPLKAGDGITVRDCYNGFALNRGLPPFEWAASFAAVLHPTTTEAERRALFADVMDKAGNGSRYDADIKALILTGKTRMNVTPADHESRYGKAWDGAGGSLAHGVC